MDAGRAAVGPSLVQPGKSHANSLSSLQAVLGGLEAGGGGGRVLHLLRWYWLVQPHVAAASGAGADLQGLLSGLCSLVQRFEVGAVIPSPVSGWVPGQSGRFQHQQ